MTDRLDYGATDDKTMPAVAYALYLLGPVTVITPIVGLIIAYATQGSASPKMRSHYTFLIRTFWITIVAVILGCMVLVVGIPLSFILIGIPLLVIGSAVMTVAAIYFFVRTLVGVIYLARDEAYPRPYALLL
ncbi:hypothetical protein [Phenylobacterium sp.]|jgi:uncharacterized membrane protein|uniref:DUF4870 family protein n=1 Tax=Phenylobacterium sp. TaxID=1871053 RepID=UPI002F946FE3